MYIIRQQKISEWFKLMAFIKKTVGLTRKYTVKNSINTIMQLIRPMISHHLHNKIIEAHIKNARNNAILIIHNIIA